METSSWNRALRRHARTLTASLTIAAMLAACGGGGAGGQGGDPIQGGDSSQTAVTSIQIVTDQPQLLSDGSNTATITAVLKDARNNVVARQPVSMSSDDPNTSLTPLASPQVTSAAGKASATLELQASSLAARTNRTVTVTATSGQLSQTISIPVSGTKITLSGDGSLASGAFADYQAVLHDAGGHPIAGARVELKSALGNGITVVQETTGNDGIARFRVSGAVGGKDTLTASALGASGTLSVTVAAASTVSGLNFSPTTLDVGVNTNSEPITITYLLGAVPQPNQQLTLALTRGIFVDCSCTTTTVTTDGAGRAVVNVKSPTVGSATMTAIATADTSISSNMALRFYSGPQNASKVSVSASTSSVGVNAVGSPGNNKSVISAVVRDASDNPVQGATVLFSADADPSGGSLSPASAVTDATGTAATTFTPGATSTGPNAVIIKSALASNAAVAATTQLTVNAVALFVDLGTGNTITALNDTAYQMPWTAQVTDASQQAVKGQTVTASMTSAYGGDTSNPTLKYYYKGVWVWNGTSWVATGFNHHPTPPSGNPVACLNEDVNQNNILDPGEDKNGNGKLDPGSPASVFVSGLTDDNGMVPLSVTYAKSFGNWVNVSLRSTIATSGTQSSAMRTFLLPVLSSDVNSQDKAPPNVGATIVWGNQTYLKGPYGADPAKDANGFCTSPD